MKTRIALFLFLLLPALGTADDTPERRTFDAPTLRLQDKAEELYRNGHFERAHFIYVNELAAVGDKYAQYMAGYMCLFGKGVPRDPVRASAWYRLAAERGAPEFIAARDELLESMGEELLLASDAVYVGLRQQYSDLVLAMAALRDERELLNESPTGSHLSDNSSPIRIVDLRTGKTISRGEYLRRVESRMQVRLDYITDKLGIEPVEPDMSDREFAELSARVSDYLELIDDR